MKKLATLALTALLVVGLASCDEEDLLSENNPNQLSTTTFYQNQAQAEAAVNAVYANLQTIGLYIRRYYFVYDLLAGEAAAMGSLESDLRQFAEYTVAPSNPTLNELWDSLNRGVQRANLVIENVPNVPEAELGDALRNRYLAEARFLRAWYLYELAVGWDEVPLLTRVANQDDIEGIPAASTDEIFAVVHEDLDFAEQHLLRKDEYTEDNTGRVTKGAAAALRGKVLLFQGDYQGAAAEFEKFIDGGTYASEYHLVDEYFDNFTEESENNQESIFEVQFAATGGSGNWSAQGSGVYEATYRGQEYGMTSWRNVIPSPRLVDEYEEGDPRRDMNFYEPCDTYNAGQLTYYTPTSCPPPEGQNATVPDDRPSWRKYQNYYKFDVEPFAESGINFRVIRLADVMLSLADAYIELGRTDEAVALMNEVRARPSVDMPPYPTVEYPVSTKQEALDALYHEIASEFAGEQVLYKFLKRRPAYMEEWVTASSFNPSVHLRLPFPQSEVDANNALSQKSGY